jgi:glycosyltransferase involved in cell wall biosynthesis
MTLVSVVTPSFNQAAYIRQTITSVLEQQGVPIEYLVVDGGSTDGSLEIIREYEARLAWWVSEPDAGQSDAINKGMRHAQGDIVAWLNSDDYYLPGAVEAACSLLERDPSAVLVYGDVKSVDKGGETINMQRFAQVDLGKLLCFEIIGQPAVFMRRDAYLEAGGLDTSLHVLLDHQLWIKMAKAGRLLHADQAWAASRYHRAAKNRARASEFGQEALRILSWAETDADLAPMLRSLGTRARASAARVNARYLLDGGQPAASLRAWAEAFRLNPPTALSRLNLLASASLELIGLGSMRRAFLRRRTHRYRA